MSKRIALITGSSKGLGRCLALEFSNQGYDIIIHGRDKAILDEIENEIRKKGECYSVVGDIAEEKTLEVLAEEAKKRNIDVLVNNAGIYLSKTAGEMSIEELRKVMEVNFFAHVSLTKKLIPYFLEKGKGLIVNINSVAGKQGSLGESAYAASKHALKGFFDSLSFELTKSGIMILNVYSGAIATKMTAGRKNQENLMKPAEVAKAIVKNCELYDSLGIREINLGKLRYG